MTNWFVGLLATVSFLALKYIRIKAFSSPLGYLYPSLILTYTYKCMYWSWISGISKATGLPAEVPSIELACSKIMSVPILTTQWLYDSIMMMMTKLPILACA